MLYDSHGNIFYCCFQDIQKVSIKISEIQLLFFFCLFILLCVMIQKTGEGKVETIL